MWLFTPESRIQCFNWLLFVKTPSCILLPTSQNTEFEVLGSQSNRRIQDFMLRMTKIYSSRIVMHVQCACNYKLVHMHKILSILYHTVYWEYFVIPLHIIAYVSLYITWIEPRIYIKYSNNLYRCSEVCIYFRKEQVYSLVRIGFVILREFIFNFYTFDSTTNDTNCLIENNLKFKIWR